MDKRKSMSDLKTHLIRQIRQAGPIDMGAYMRECLCHPEYGYYMGRDPLGAAGDFTTAPEISQMFGEVIGLCLADYWMRIGSPPDVTLLECGPGRGTLMADILRATKIVPGFHEALHVHLMEVSPFLQDKQRAALADFSLNHAPVFCGGLAGVKGAGPLLVLGNEFLDALPVRQLIKHQGRWQERVVAVSEEGEELVYGVRPPLTDAAHIVPEGVQGASEDNVYEFSPAREAYVSGLCDTLKARGGAALFIDYGEAESKAGDSFHAIRDHEPISVLMAPGESDLSANVDFAAVEQVARAQGAHVFGIVEQGAFLSALGIAQRAQALVAGAQDEAAQDIGKALHRLTHSDQMGSMFKVIGFGYGYDDIALAGFGA